MTGAEVALEVVTGLLTGVETAEEALLLVVAAELVVTAAEEVLTGVLTGADEAAELLTGVLTAADEVATEEVLTGVEAEAVEVLMALETLLLLVGGWG